MGIRLKRRALETYQKLSKLNDSQLADVIGVSREHVWRVKNEKCEPGSQFVSGCLNAFSWAGVRFEDLFIFDEVLRDGNGTESVPSEGQGATV